MSDEKSAWHIANAKQTVVFIVRSNNSFSYLLLCNKQCLSGRHWSCLQFGALLNNTNE